MKRHSAIRGPLGILAIAALVVALLFINLYGNPTSGFISNYRYAHGWPMTWLSRPNPNCVIIVVDGSAFHPIQYAWPWVQSPVERPFYLAAPAFKPVGIVVDLAFAAIALGSVFFLFRPGSAPWTRRSIASTILILIGFFALLWFHAGTYPQLTSFLAYSYVNISFLIPLGYYVVRQYPATDEEESQDET